jgi:hypothetical protein
MRRLFLLVIAVLSITACGSPPAKEAAEPAVSDPKAPANAPAVIAVPLNVPTPVVPGTPGSRLIPTDPMQQRVAVSQGYGLIGAMMVFQDGRSLSQLYHADAILKTPDSTIAGNGAIVTHLLTLARNKSLSSFERTSRRITLLDDSTLTDSGSYRMVLRRSAADSVFERGAYATNWRARSDITKWVILEDHLAPGAAPKAKGAR